MKALAGICVAVVGFVAAIYVPTGPPLFAAITAFAVGAGMVADAWLDVTERSTR